MFKHFLVVCIFIFKISEAHQAHHPPKALTENGWVAGERRDNYNAFEGLRYAAPPVGANRFQPPKRYTKHWKHCQNFVKPGPACIHWNTLPQPADTDKLVGNEDCLFVNVYTPAKKHHSHHKFPVLVHIHGGAYKFGEGAFYGPEHIMRRGNFVFVNFNYRLGIFGFLSTKSSVVPGNMGLKDQVMALKWVKRNIAAFNGDVKSITLTGWGAGSASTHLHYMSPLSVGLFHRGVSHSGTALVPWIMQKDPLGKTLLLADRVNCSNSDQQAMIDCLRTKPAADLARTVATLTDSIGTYLSHPFIPYAAVIEDEHDGAFITKSPRQYLKQGDIQKLPWLVATVREPGVFLTADLYNNETIDKINSNWTQYAGLLADLSYTSPKAEKLVTSYLKSNFFCGSPISKENFNQISQIESQRYFQCGVEEAIDLQRSLAPVYAYLFDFKIQYGFGEFLGQSNVNLGVALGEDILLIHKTPLHAPPYKYTDDEKLMTKRLLEMYSTYACNGVPVFNKHNLTRSDDSVKMTVIEGPETARLEISKPICNEFWGQVAEFLTDVV